MNSESSGARQPLTGITVLDFGHFIAGPLCGALLADFGADVIRIERPDGGSDRHVQPVSDDPEAPGGAIYLQLNRNKKSLALDAFNPAARPVIDRLVERADVVIANVPAATLEAMGLTYPRLRAINPRIVLCTCTAYGSQGALASRPGFDGIGQAMSGAMRMTGKDGEPRKASTHYVDYCTATLSAFGIMAALRARDFTGTGQQVEASLLGTAMFTAASGLAEEAALHIDRDGMGNRGQLAAPADTFKARDGWFMLQVLGDSMFRRCAKVIGRPEWIADPRFADDLVRGRHTDILSEGVAAWCATRTVDECLTALASVGLPSAPVLSFRQALSHPHINEQGFWRRHDIAGIAEPLPISEPPIRLSETPGSVRDMAPVLGADSAAVLRNLGFDDSELQALRAGGAL